MRVCESYDLYFPTQLQSTLLVDSNGDVWLSDQAVQAPRSLDDVLWDDDYGGRWMGWCLRTQGTQRDRGRAPAAGDERILGWRATFVDAGSGVEI